MVTAKQFVLLPVVQIPFKSLRSLTFGAVARCTYSFAAFTEQGLIGTSFAELVPANAFCNQSGEGDEVGACEHSD